MHKDRPSSAQWPLQVGIDPYAAMVLRAIPPEIAKSRLETNLVGQNQLDTLWLCQNSYGKWPIIVSFPMEKMVIFHSHVKLPEGTPALDLCPNVMK